MLTVICILRSLLRYDTQFSVSIDYKGVVEGIIVLFVENFYFILNAMVRLSFYPESET